MPMSSSASTSRVLPSYCNALDTCETRDVLAEELIGIGAENVEIGTRMVSFTGDKALMYKANIHCRTALRILKPILTFKAENADEVYDEVKKMNWTNTSRSTKLSLWIR